uniref:Uncharacterized protein n=1 Tax=Romanomermis culicivorax TaxID=13658 RepID=A0A915HFJ2_ROMCU
MHIRRRVKRYKCCQEPYIDVQFVLDIERRSTFNGFCIISPYILLSLASLMSFLVNLLKLEMEVAGSSN